MKKLLAVAAVAAATLVPSALPAEAAPTQPAPGSTLLCTVRYAVTRTMSFGGSVIAQDTTVSGTCLDLQRLQVLPVTNGPGDSITDGPNCVSGATLKLTIGTGFYPVIWEPTLSSHVIGLTMPVVATGPVHGNGTTGSATLVGTTSCVRTDGTMVLSLTVGGSA